MSHILHSPPLPPPPHENKQLNIESTLSRIYFYHVIWDPQQGGEEKDIISFPLFST